MTALPSFLTGVYWFKPVQHCDDDKPPGEMVAFTIDTPKPLPAGSVEYFGVVKGARMTLNWRSRINGAVQNGVDYQLMS